MSQYWSDIVHRLTPYVPGEQPKQQQLIKLNTNECPYGPSPKALAAIEAEVNNNLRLYPDPNAERLTQAIADYFSLASSANSASVKLSPENVFVGNGSDEVLAHVFNGLLAHNKPILFPDISYSFYPVYCNLYNISAQPIPLSEDFSIAVEDYQQDNGGIIIPNPNAPTGILLSLDDIKCLLISNPNSVVVIDEAYIDFGGQSAVTLVPQFKNLLVIQTLSKSRSLAGLRVGFAVGDADLISGLNRVKNSFNSYPLSRMSISGAVAAIEDRSYFNDICQQVIKTREWLSAELTQLEFTVLPSSANFVFVRHAEKSAADIAAQLRQRNIIVRHFNTARIDNYLRISVGSDEECKALIMALTTIVGRPA